MQCNHCKKDISLKGQEEHYFTEEIDFCNECAKKFIENQQSRIHLEFTIDLLLFNKDLRLYDTDIFDPNFSEGQIPENALLSSHEETIQNIAGSIRNHLENHLANYMLDDVYQDVEIDDSDYQIFQNNHLIKVISKIKEVKTYGS